MVSGEICKRWIQKYADFVSGLNFNAHYSRTLYFISDFNTRRHLSDARSETERLPAISSTFKNTG